MTDRHDLSLHLVTADGMSTDDLCTVADAAVSAGITVVQLRDKGLDARPMLDRVRALANVIAGRAALVVNDRLDVAVAARDAGIPVDGVHLGQQDVPPTTARRLLGPRALIGWTANSVDHLATLATFPEGTVDYLGVGVVHATSSKDDHPEVLGTHGIGVFAARTPKPCVAIGGVTAADVPALRDAGAAGIAVISAICAAADPGAAATELVDRWAGARRKDPR